MNQKAENKAVKDKNKTKKLSSREVKVDKVERAYQERRSEG